MPQHHLMRRARNHQLARTGSSAGRAAPVGDASHGADVTYGEAVTQLSALARAGWAAAEMFETAARQASALRGALDDLADDLRRTHNVIGRRTSVAVGALGEYMERLESAAVLAAASSRASAEQVEALLADMAAAYEGMQTRTVDAGLATPSAAAHNQP